MKLQYLSYHFSNQENIHSKLHCESLLCILDTIIDPILHNLQKENVKHTDS